MGILPEIERNIKIVLNCGQMPGSSVPEVFLSIVYNNAAMEAKVLDFLKKEHVSVLTTLLPDGSPHSASMHFAMQDDGNHFVFFTKNVSRKCGHFETGIEYPASLVVGFDERQMIEFQSEGIVQKVSEAESELCEKVFASKFEGAKLDDEHIVLKFTPKWWRYTEFKPEFKAISSED